MPQGAGKPTFDPAKRYTLKGDTLAKLIADVASQRVKPQFGLGWRQGPDGLEIWVKPAAAVVPRRWSVYSDGENLKLRLGKVYNGDTEVTITGGTSALSAADGYAVWLERTGGLPTTASFSMALTSGAWPGTGEYVLSSGVMSTYRKRLGDFFNADPGIGGQQVGDALWYRPRVADSDLLAIPTVVQVLDGEALVAALAMELTPL